MTTTRVPGLDADALAALRTRAERWLADDPDPAAAAELRRVLDGLPATAGVMVTASHNPPADNGYKVYLGAGLGGPAGDGAQLVPPADAAIEESIRRVGPLATVPLGQPGEVLGPEIVASYVDGAAAVVDAMQPKELAVAYTPLHG